MSPGKNPNRSPASTAGLDKIILSIFFSNNIVKPTATARKVFPVPAGPAEIIISLFCLLIFNIKERKNKIILLIKALHVFINFIL